MIENIHTLLAEAKVQEITTLLDDELQKRNESPIWKTKVVPFSEAVLSVLVQLREQDLLFDPQGDYKEDLTLDLFYEWMDFVSLKMLAFTLQKSNEAKELLRTNVDAQKAKNYQEVDLTKLASYLAKNSVNLERENLDFPIAVYNLHQGVLSVIKSLIEK